MSGPLRGGVSPPALDAAGSVSGATASSCCKARVATRPNPAHILFALRRGKEHGGVLDKGIGQTGSHSAPFRARGRVKENTMDWTDCPLIERVPGKLSGVPVIRHSRVRTDDLLVNRSEGEVWLAEAYRLPLDTVRQVLAFYDQHESQLAPAV